MADASAAAPSRPLVSLFVTALALWIGGSVYFSTLVLPPLFIYLPTPAEAGTIAALLFPFYFRAGLALSLVTLVLAVLLARSGTRLWKAVVALLTVMVLTEAYLAVMLHPEMVTLRGKPEHGERFQALHERSVQLNNIILGGGMILLLSSGLLILPRRERTA